MRQVPAWGWRLGQSCLGPKKERKAISWGGGGQDGGPQGTGDAKAGRTLGSVLILRDDPCSHLRLGDRDPSWVGKGPGGREEGVAPYQASCGEQLPTPERLMAHGYGIPGAVAWATWGSLLHTGPHRSSLHPIFGLLPLLFICALSS